MHRRVILFLMLLVAVPLLAQTQHLVSRIDVRGNVPAAIVQSQSALAAGRSYSDKDLEVAMARLRRLPFVFDARYTIEGETLVVEVDAVNRFFAELDASGIGYEGRQTGGASVAGGARFFLGSGGVAQARATEIVTEGDDGSLFDADYSHYGIGGTRLYAAAGVSQSVSHDDHVDFDPTWRLTLGYPLTVRQTLSASYSDEGFSSRRSLPVFPVPLESSGDRSLLSLRWTWDTSDDPYFARNGLTISAGPTWSDASSRFDGAIIFAPDGPSAILSYRSDVTSTALAVEARKFWATGTRGTWFSGLSADRTRSEHDTEEIGIPEQQHYDSDTNTVAVTAGYAHNLFDWNARPGTRQRLELGATYSRQTFDQPFFSGVTVDSTALHAAYVLRRQFATVRLNLSYTFNDDFINVAVPAQPIP
jgi:hypothetical protein